MATITHLQWLDAMLGGGVHPVPDLLTAASIGVSLLDETDSGTITSAFIDYAEVNAAVVVHSTTLTITATTGGVATVTPSTFSTVTGDAADFLTVFSGTTAATAALILTWDSATSGLPVTPNGGDIINTWGSNILVTLA